MQKWCAHFSRLGIECIPESSVAFGEFVLISIRDPKSVKPNLRCKFHDVLELEFHDIPEPWDVIKARLISITDDEKEAFANYIFPAPEHAKAIAEFIRKHMDRSIIVHCEAGVSRSAAVCSVLCDLGWEYRRVLHFGMDHANGLLKRMLREELAKELEEAYGH